MKKWLPRLDRTRFLACLLTGIAVALLPLVADAAAPQLIVRSGDSATTLRDCPDCPEMVVLAPGSFAMGSADAYGAGPVHRVTIKAAFAIGRTEVTEKEFRFFLQRSGYDAGDGYSQNVVPASPRLPAVNLDWHAAMAYARWLSRYTGQRYRLPSEAEWEYAARGGTTTRYWWGDSPLDACGREHAMVTFSFDQPCAATRNDEVIEVGSLAANPWGLYDMMGNAGEWQLDCPPTYPPTKGEAYVGAPTNGTPFSGGREFCVVRGPEVLEDAAPRNLGINTFRPYKTGFRVVREMP